jgi:phospholipid transport system substrate-binding protein
MTSRVPVVIFFVVVAAVSSPWHAVAGTPTDELRTRIERIHQIVTAADVRPEDRRTAIAAADEIFDWPAIAQDLLGTQWEARTPEEREEFTRLFAHFFALVFTSKAQFAQADHFEFLGDDIEGERAVVRTATVKRQGGKRHVTYRMRRHGGERWKVYAFDVEGMNLIDNYGAQFQQILKRGSYGDLAKTLRDRSAALDK